MRFLLLLLPALVAAKCPLNGLQYGDLCYFYSPIVASWKAAEEICQTRGGHLASIHNQAQNDFIFNSVIQGRGIELNDSWVAAYLGGYYDYAARKWKWTDNSPMDYTNYMDDSTPVTPFLGIHPLGIQMITGMLDVVSLLGKWFNQEDDLGNYAKGFVCQVPPCDANGVSAPSLLAPITKHTALFYMISSNSWFYGCPNCLAKKYLPQEGELLCQSIGGHLPSVVNAFQNTDLYNGMQQICKQVSTDFETFLFGLTSDASGSNWTFNDGTPVVFTNWGNFEPKKYSHTAYSFIKEFDGVWYTDNNNMGWNGHDLGCQIKVDINIC